MCSEKLTGFRESEESLLPPSPETTGSLKDRPTLKLEKTEITSQMSVYVLVDWFKLVYGRVSQL